MICRSMYIYDIACMYVAVVDWYSFIADILYNVNGGYGIKIEIKLELFSNIKWNIFVIIFS